MELLLNMRDVISNAFEKESDYLLGINSRLIFVSFFFLVGMAPFLFSSLVLQSLSIDDKYILYYGDKRHTKIMLRKITLQIFMCMLNYTQKNILWWSVTGLIGAIAIHTTQTREIPKDDTNHRIKLV